MAQALGVTQQQISKWENGTTVPRDRHRALLARTLGLPVYELFPYDDTNGEAAA